MRFALCALLSRLWERGAVFFDGVMHGRLCKRGTAHILIMGLWFPETSPVRIQIKISEVCGYFSDLLNKSPLSLKCNYYNKYLHHN